MRVFGKAKAVLLVKGERAMEAVATKEKRETARSQYLPMVLCWLVYTAAYLGRYSYAANISVVIDAFGVTRADAGLVSTFFFFAYGIGQVVNGIFAKYYPRRVIIPLALFVSTAVNAAVFLGAPFASYKFLWLLNGISQSLLWPNLVSALSDTLRANVLSKAILLMSSTVAVGTFVSYGGSALFSLFGGFRYSFLFGAASMLAVGLLWICLYKRAFTKREKTAPAKDAPQSVSQRPRGLAKSLLPLVLVLGLFAIINNLVKDGLNTWMPRFLKEAFGLPDSLSMILTLVLPVLGFFGAACATSVHKKIPSFVLHGGLWFFLSVLMILGCVLLLNTSLWWLLLLLFGIVSLSMHGINNIITSMAPLYMRERVNAGLLAGILNGCCYVGSTLSSYGLGAVADYLDWSGVFLVLLCAAAIPVLISAFQFVLTRKKQD